MLLVDLLADMGHRVTEASDIAEATEHLENGDFDVLVTDVSLPDGSGLKLAEHAVSQTPSLRIVIASGMTADAGSWPRSWAVVNKPFDDAALRAAVLQTGAV